MTPKHEFNLTMPCSTVSSRKQLMKVQTQVTACPRALRWSSPSLRAPPPVLRQAQVCPRTQTRLQNVCLSPCLAGVLERVLRHLFPGWEGSCHLPRALHLVQCPLPSASVFSYTCTKFCLVAGNKTSY